MVETRAASRILQDSWSGLYNAVAGRATERETERQRVQTRQKESIDSRNACAHTHTYMDIYISGKIRKADIDYSLNRKKGNGIEEEE